MECQTKLETGMYFYYLLFQLIHTPMFILLTQERVAMVKVQFIVVSDLSDLTSVHTKKVARKHSAREAHARERRTRTVNFQTRHRHFQQPLPDVTRAVLSAERHDSELLLPSPVDLVSAHRNDPFDTFALPMGRKEQLLFDHCKIDKFAKTVYQSWLSLGTCVN